MTTRRNVLKQMALFSAGTLLSARSMAEIPSRPDRKIGVQLYTVRNEIFKDAKGTLGKVAELGYREVENFGYNGRFFGMEAGEYRRFIEGLGLTAPSGHYMLAQLQNGWEKAVEDAASIGQKYMVLAFLMPGERKTTDQYRQVAATLNKAGEIAAKAGIQLCYHNHDFEFERIDGILPFDILMKETDPGLVKAELDLYWSVKAGQQPLDLFRQYKGRIALWHVKDMDATDKKNFTEVGNGVIDFASIFKKHRQSGMQHFFVEQDICPGSPFDSIGKSIGHIRSKLLKYV